MIERALALHAGQASEPLQALLRFGGFEIVLAEPLLELDLRLGEGSGAALAVPLVRLACDLHGQMATFAEAAVADRRSGSGGSAGMTTLHLDLLRHGETEQGGGLRGSLDDALTDQGWEQMRQAVLGRGPWCRLVSSPLQRCAGGVDADRCRSPGALLD